MRVASFIAGLALGCRRGELPPDADHDGVIDAKDCAPYDAGRFPGRAEVCNGVDDDCDDTTVEFGARGTTGSWPTIQQAIDAAAAGDIVHVCAGVYEENLDVARDLVLESVAGAADTTLDGGGRGSVISVHDGASLTLRGFTVTGGTGTRYSPFGGIHHVGGGLLARYAGDLVVDQSVFTGNGPVWAGGAMDVEFSRSLTLTDSTVTGNHAGGVGGGAQVWAVERLDVRRTTFSENTSDWVGAALWVAAVPDCAFSDVDVTANGPANPDAYTVGPLYLLADTVCTLIDTRIERNHATEAGGMQVENAAVSLVRSAVRDNAATAYGGGVLMVADNGVGYASVGAALTADDASIVEGNTVGTADAPGWGGGIAAYMYGYDAGGVGNTMAVTGVRVADNTAVGGGGGGIWYLDDAGSSVFVLDDVALVDNVSDGYAGGGLLVEYPGYDPEGGPDVVIRGSVLQGNTAGGGGGGGGSLFWPGSVTVAGTVVEDNHAGWAGALDLTGAMACALEATTVRGNVGDDEAGGVALSPRDAAGAGLVVPPDCTVTDSAVTANTTRGLGGGVVTSGTLTLVNTLVEGNTADGGGGILLSDGAGTAVAIDADASSVVTGNTAGSGGGVLAWPVSGAGFAVSGLRLAANTADDGGGIAVSAGASGCSPLTLTGVTLDGNQAVDGGGLFAGCPTAVLDSAVRANAADAGGGAFVAADGTLLSSGSTWGTGPDGDNTPEDVRVSGVPFDDLGPDFLCRAASATCVVP